VTLKTTGLLEDAMRVMVFAGVLAVLAFSVMPAHAAKQTADARFRAIYAGEWKWREAQFADDEEAPSRSSIICPRSTRPSPVRLTVVPGTGITQRIADSISPSAANLQNSSMLR
jgi:hypothetical protein